MRAATRVIFEGGEALGAGRLDSALRSKISEIVSCEGGVKPILLYTSQAETIVHHRLMPGFCFSPRSGRRSVARGAARQRKPLEWMERIKPRSGGRMRKDPAAATRLDSFSLLPGVLSLCSLHPWLHSFRRYAA